MADIKDTVAAHITANWNAAVLGGSGAVPVADAVGPEDILKPEDYPEAILVYNETVGWDRTYNQHTRGDRHTRVYMLLTAHTRTGCTKVHFRAFIDELKSVFGSAITGFDVQTLDPETNVTRTSGHAGGMYQASFLLHLYEYGVSTSSAAAGGAAGASYWAEPFIVWQASANLTNEKTLEAALQDIDSYGDTFRSDNAMKLQPSGDTDDYLEFSTVAGKPYISVVGGSDLILETDTNYKSLNFGASNSAVLTHSHVGGYTRLTSTKPIRFMPDGDTDDYLQFETISDTPHIKVIGGNTARFWTDQAQAQFHIAENSAAVDNQGMWLGAFAGYQRILCNDPLRLMVSDDTDDYLEFYTTAGAPCIKTVGYYGPRFESDDATYSVTYHWDDSDHYSYIGFLKTGHAAVWYSKDSMRLQPNSDIDDYISLHTDAGVPHIDAIGACGMVLASDATDAITINAAGTVTMDTAVTFSGATSGIDTAELDDAGSLLLPLHAGSGTMLAQGTGAQATTVGAGWTQYENNSAFQPNLSYYDTARVHAYVKTTAGGNVELRCSTLDSAGAWDNRGTEVSSNSAAWVYVVSGAVTVDATTRGLACEFQNDTAAKTAYVLGPVIELYTA